MGKTTLARFKSDFNEAIEEYAEEYIELVKEPDEHTRMIEITIWATVVQKYCDVIQHNFDRDFLGENESLYFRTTLEIKLIEYIAAKSDKIRSWRLRDVSHYFVECFPIMNTSSKLDLSMGQIIDLID